MLKKYASIKYTFISKLLIFILCFYTIASTTERKKPEYNLLHGTPENNVAIYTDKDFNCIMYTEYLGENFGVLIRCLMARSIVSDDSIRSKIISLINRFVPKKYRNDIIAELSKKNNNKILNNKFRITVAGYTECFVEVDFLSESVLLTIKSIV